LAGKIVFAEGAAKLPEHFGRLAFGVEGRARLAAEGLPSEHGLESAIRPPRAIADKRTTSQSSCASTRPVMWSPPPRQHPADRGRDAKALRRRLEFALTTDGAR